MKTKLPLLAQGTVSEARVLRDQTGQTFNNAARVERFSPTCTKGCSHCCYLPVMSTVLEGISMHQWLSDHHEWKGSLKEDLRQHLELVRNLPWDTWAQAMIPCPFLKDNLCGVYEGRPLACRTTISIGDPHYCHPHRLGPHTNFMDRSIVSDSTQATETRLLRQHNAPFLFLPLSGSILVGERFNQGDLQLEDMGSALRALYHG